MNDLWWALEELRLSIKLGFKLLYTFGLSLKHKIVFFIRQPFQVSGAVIIFNSVQVMDYPSWGQRFFIRLFPDPNMFQNEAMPICSGMVRYEDKYISACRLISFADSSFIPFSFQSGVDCSDVSCFPIMLRGTRPASLCCFPRIIFPILLLIDRFATVRAKSCYRPLSVFVLTIYTAFGLLRAWLSAIQTGMLVFLFPFPALFFRPHIVSIAYMNLNSNRMQRCLK